MKRLFAFFLLLLCPVLGFVQTDSSLDLGRIAKDVEQRIKACPRREVVANFKRGFHKSVWQKEAWGPPSDVIADVRSNDSLLYPYVLSVEFSLRINYAPERKTKMEAEADTELSPSAVLMQLGADASRNRNVYLVSKNGIRLKTREVLRKLPTGKPIEWVERSGLPGVCWDWIGTE